MSDSPYRTAPMAEWPRSLRAAYKLGQASHFCAVHLSLPPMVAGLVLSTALGGMFGYAIAHDKYKPPGDVSACHIESAGFPWSGSGYSVELVSHRGTIAPFREMGAAVDAAAKVGCRLAP